MAQADAADKTGGDISNKVTTEIKDDDGNPNDSQTSARIKNKSKENTENINIDMTIGELLGVMKCEAYAKKFTIFELAGDITQYTKKKFQEFLTTKCEIDEYSQHFVKLGKAYDTLKKQQNQSNGM